MSKRKSVRVLIVGFCAFHPILKGTAFRRPNEAQTPKILGYFIMPNNP